MKKKLLALLSVFAAATMLAFGAIGCGEKPDNSQDTGSGNVSTDTGSDTTEDKTPTLTVSQSTLSMEVYESATLTAELKNSEEEIRWSSSDESVVKVVDGVVTAYKAGSATVTATAGDLTASCEITVAEATETPVFANLDESLTLIKGTSEELDFSLTYKGEAFEMATVSVTTESDKISVSENVVTAVEYGEATLTVTATVNGEAVATATVTVNVVEFGTLIVDLPENKLQLWIGQEGYALSNITAQINGVNVENPEFTVVSNDENVVVLADGKLTPVAVGETAVTVSFTTEMATYDTTITVTVSKQQVVKSVNFFVQGDAGKTSAETGNAVIDLSATEIDLSTVSKVICEEEEVEFSFEGANITLVNAYGGYKLYTLVTPMVDYVIDGMVYGYSVSTAEELLEWRKNMASWKAYTVLMNDIDLGGVVLEEGVFQLKGGLDGRGYTVSNFTYSETSGFFYYINAGAEVRNIQFVNAVQDCTGQEEGKAVIVGLFGNNLMGTVENVLVKTTVKNMLEGTDHYGILTYYFAETGMMKNVVIYAEAANCTPHYFFGCGAGAESAGANVIENVRMVCAGTGFAACGQSAISSGGHASTDAMVQEAKFDTWGGLWQVVDGVPYMSDYSDDELNAYVEAAGKATVGGTITFNTTSFYPLTYALAEEVTGITVENNQVAIGADASIGAEFTVNVTCEAIPEFSKQISFTVEKEAVVLEEVMLAQGNGGKWEYTTGKATFDFTDKGVDLTNVSSVLLDGVAFNDYVIDGNKLVLTNAPGGDHIYTIDTPTATYTVKGCVYVLGISTVEELEAWRTSESYWYAVLLNDIDYEGATLTDGANVLGV
ncbi:MAG: Ig-like domain-containing protein, partial [Clostridia bacterium]|nr:Ig-like domain-containing protein [Clostridia bacterium]